MPSDTPAIALRGASRRHRRRGPLALANCTFEVPAGSVCALVGANGAGKSTLLELVAGLQQPTAGRVEVFGERARAGNPHVAYLAQDRPLPARLTVGQTLRFGASANPDSWDARVAEQVVDFSRLDPGDRVGDLSGGERTRVALALAMGKQAGVLLLDEPMADVDVVARQELMGLLLAQAAATGATVVMSSHILGELADACDHLLVLHRGAIRLAGGIDDLIGTHAVVTLPGRTQELAGHEVIEARPAGRGTSALIRPHGPLPETWDVRPPSLEELVIAHLTTTAPQLQEHAA